MINDGEVTVKILAIERELSDATAESFRVHLNEEAAQVWELYQAGVIRELYFRDDETAAVLILECENAAEAEVVLTALPLVKAGLITFEVIPLVPYPGFARLFADTGSS